MADSKITALTSIGTITDPAVDPLVIVDVSDTSMAATGTTKKVTLNNLLACSPTATLASATITGALTANGGIAMANATAITSGGAVAFYVDTNQVALRARATNGIFFQESTGTNNLLTISNAGVFGFLDGAGGTRMTLNASGLGVGVASPTSKLTIGTGSFSAAASGTTGMYTTASGLEILSDSYFFGNRTGGGLMTLNSSGNVGIGVTPSAWISAVKALQISSYGSVAGSSSNFNILGNLYSSPSGTAYVGNGLGTLLQMTGGQYVFYQAPNNTLGAGASATLNPSMTLDASGNLLVGQTSASGTTVGCYLSAGGQFNAATANQDNLNIYNTTAAAYRFYVNSSGTVFATNTTISAISDARLKENVQDLDVGLNEVLALKPRKFDWKAGKGKDIKGDRGFIAQEFETVFPNLIDEWKDEAPEGEAPYKSVRADLIPVLVKAIQELTARVQTLEAK